MKKISWKKRKIVLDYYNEFLNKKGIISRQGRGFLKFHPSSFGDCLRKIAFQYHSEQNDKYKINIATDIKFMKICDAGHAFHDRMQYDFSKMGILRGWWRCKKCNKILGKENKIGIFLPDICDCIEDPLVDKRRGLKLFEYEEIFLKSEEEFNFQGNCDGIIEIEKDNPDLRFIIDFKSINEKSYGNLFTSEPNKKYTIQVMIYMWLSGIHKAILYFEDKNKHEISEYVIDYDEEAVEEIKNTSRKLKKICELGGIPKIPQGYSSNNSPCNSFFGKCDYYDFCYLDKKGGRVF